MSPDPITLGTPAYRRLAVAMTVSGFSTFSLLYSVQPLLPNLSAQFAVSAETASLAVSLATLPLAFGILVATAIADRHGRRPLMIAALAIGALFSLLTALAPTWPLLLVTRFLTGLALAGLPAVAMAYLAEEVEPAAIGPAMGLYIAGSAMGGMVGRLAVAFLSSSLGWRQALLALALVGIVAAGLFWALAPKSRGFTPRRESLGRFLEGYRDIARDRILALLCLEGFLLMGAFIAIYNYLAYRLVAPPYGLSEAEIGAVFLLYILGSASSALFGRIAGRRGVRWTFPWPLLMMIGGIALTLAAPLWVILAGIGLITAGFFGTHSVASSWVSRRAFDRSAHAGALYLFCSYAGSSLFGSLGGIPWSNAGWPGVALFTGGLSIIGLLIAWPLVRSVPLRDPRQPQRGQSLPG